MFVVKIAYVYFEKTPGKAQIMAFVLLGNDNERKLYGWMFNDEIMALYLIICIYFCATNRPYLATFFFTLGLSVKAGCLLLLPAFFG